MNMSEMSGNYLKNILEINIFPLKLISMERYTDAGIYGIDFDLDKCLRKSPKG